VTEAATQVGERETAARNAFTLGTALAVTGSIALIVRVLVPRFLGPVAFGEYRLAEAAAELWFVVLTFGVDAHLRREAALDPSRARGYLSGLAALRTAVGVAGIAATSAILWAAGARATTVFLFALLATSQVFVVLNNSYAAYEHAAGDVRWIARTNLATKVLWAGAVVGVLWTKPAGVTVALVAVLIEGGRFAWLTARGVRRHDLALRPDVRFAGGAMLASLPFFVNTVAHSLYARIGTGWLGAVSSDAEVGRFGAASGLASIALLGMPLISWVLVPSAARAAARSAGEMTDLVASSLRVSLLVFVPVALAFFVGAEFLLALFFGPAYVPAAPVLRVLAPTFVLAYASTVCAIALIQRGRIRFVAGLSVAGVGVTVLLDALLIPWGMATLGETGGAQGAALATLGTEMVVTATLAWMSRDAWQDPSLRRTSLALGAGLVAAAGTLAFAPADGSLPRGLALVVFAALVLTAGGVDRGDLRFCGRLVKRSRPTGPPVPAAVEVS